MYEGKNIHYSPVDQKPLCSFSGKVCNQRRLNKYGFCVRHILEDPNAPFKRCAYVAKSSRQTCTQPIPKNEEREYCNNHMQVLGMLPKKARKPKKEKEKLVPAISDPFTSQPGSMSVPLLLESRSKPKLTVSGFKTKLGSRKISSLTDMDDIYAFPTDVTDTVNKSSVSTTMITSVAIQDLSPSSSKAVTYSTFTTKSNEGAGSHSSLAKIYPELAEKLEKIKPKMADPKVKGKVKSSRTMNSLQTKIAQNKIKDKLKRNQSSSNASSQSQSPSHGFTNVNSPGCQVSPVSSPNVVVPVTSPGAVHSSPHSQAPSSSVVTNSVSEQAAGLNVSATNTIPQQPLHGLSQFNLLNSLNLQSLNSSLAQLGFPVPTASDIEQTLKQLAKAANISLEGAPGISDGTPQVHASQPSTVPVIPGLPGGCFPRPPDLLGVLKPTFTSLSGPPPPYSSIHHKPSVSVSQSVTGSGTTQLGAASEMCVTDSVKVKPSTSQLLTTPLIGVQNQSLSEQNISKFVPTVAALPNSLSFTSSHTGKGSVTTPTTAMLPVSSPTATSAIPSKSGSPLKSSVNVPQSKGVKSQDSLEHNVSNLPSQKQRPPKLKSRSRNSSALSKRPVPVFTLPMTLVKPQKIRKLLSDDEMKKFKKKSAISYYEKYKLKRECNHDLILSGFDSSDESDLSDCDMLPWQPDWFKASSDEEGCDEDESDYDLRTTKLALVRAQLRRQSFQARQSYRANLSVCRYNNDSTSSLIQAAKDGARQAVFALNEINWKRPKPVDRYKTRGLDKRRCLYKDDDEVQCKGNVVPYTNHCIKHVMYNVDQQLFEYCTAKFADNTQCCHPVIDLKHELPLCMEHGLKADNFLKTQEAEPKPKRPRKKTKPSALTRPPKKGKKKKNQRKAAQQQKALLQANEEIVGSQESEEEPPANDSGNEAVDMEDGDDETEEKEDIEVETSVPSKSALLKVASIVSRPVDQKAKSDSKPVIQSEQKVNKPSSVSQLEELENLTGLPELDNVKMFGDLPLETASKLLEENDFQEVLNRIPDEAFDIFSNKTPALPSNEELEELEKSLAMANRDLRFTKDSIDHLASSTAAPSSSSQSQQSQPVQQSSFPPILDDADELTRQIAEEILKQNIGSESRLTESSVCNGDAQESIKAIARSLSTSGMLLTSDINQRAPSQDISVIQGRNTSLSRSQSLNPYSSCVGQVFSPPNVALQSNPQLRIHPSPIPTSGFGLPKSQVAVSSAGHPALVPRNVTVTPQGVFQTQLPVSTHLAVQQAISTTVIGLTSTLNSAVSQKAATTATTGTVNFQSGPQLATGAQLTAHQLSQLVQQAALQLPPVPPYIPRQTTSITQAVVTQPIAVTSLQTSTQLAQQQLQAQQQQLVRQREQLTQQQQQLFAQQILQQHLLALAQQQSQQNQIAQKVQEEPMVNLQQHIQLGQAKTQPLLTPNVNISALLQQGHKLNHLSTMSSLGTLPVPQLIKANFPTSQPVVTSSVLAQVTLPTANIVWTAPPNVTITSSNGFTRTAIPGTTGIVTSTKGSATDKVKHVDTVIDLTDSNDPPAYKTVTSDKVFTAPPPPSYSSQKLSTSSGKSSS